MTDSSGSVIPGVSVTFSAPASGASGTFAGAGRTATVLTNALGIATAPAFTANATPGTYTVNATVSGVTNPAIFTLTNTPIPPTITTTAVPNGTTSLPYSSTLLAQNGTAPYTWSLASGTLPPGLSLNPRSGAITGTPTTAGIYSFTVKLTDSSSPTPQTATQAFNVSIVPGLTITTITLPNGTAGLAYSSTLVAQSGTPPYSWSVSSGTLPDGLSLNASTGAIAGLPTAAGTFSFTVKVVDSNAPTAQSATQILSLYLNPPITEPVTPTFSLCASPASASSCTALPATQPPAQPLSLSTQLNQPTSVAIAGTLALSFVANAANLPAEYRDPNLQFVDANGSKLGTSYNFTVPAATTSAALPSIQPGTVAGAISLTLTVGGQEVAASTITIEPRIPIIEKVQIVNVTVTGFDVELNANSTSRDVQTATFSFTPAPGAQLTGMTTFPVDVSSLLAQWYTSAEGQANGSVFSLTVPFSFSGSVSAIQSVSVTLKNSIGTSTPVTGTR